MYFNVIKAISKSRFASSVIFLFFVGMLLNNSSVILISLRFCSKVTPKTSFVSSSGAL